MNFWDVFGEMLVILFAIAAGYGANRLGYLGGETDQKISKLLLNITMPAMIVAAVVTGEELPGLGTILSILEVGVVFYLLDDPQAFRNIYLSYSRNKTSPIHRQLIEFMRGESPGKNWSRR